MCMEKKYAAQKKSEVERWTIVFGVELFWKDFVEKLQSEKGEEELSVFLVVLPNFDLVETAMRKEEERFYMTPNVKKMHQFLRLHLRLRYQVHNKFRAGISSLSVCVYYPQTPQALWQQFF
ncbi:uncharacterized protein MONOS_6852 [Monocercomonoides exilis]|uniref:uncharacterized protein n=1 Tax=Monocercomonoides exilis TaxID=2049356 RepID=UPI00355A0EF0|nr:hypothetical protein MONOS_6852 [Monocercomonoides exilis]|eukprot:MONOS_6852.1-p1 / transcript=MONOS_6852.1 / gene=MONOS_6852 / organism=Monocercomonoides_exilis_PA203 / gene_product=unspecified product / transcript_product=unspecified product / location=Mono_scaffold00224:18600-19048(-) / protein_length=121 / sequence_SO=supercontig / SO=protein_coding / is_pseudo=false